MLKFSILISLVFFSAFASSAIAQNKILDKPIDEWTKTEALEVLNYSSWAQVHRSNEGQAAASQVTAARHQGGNTLAGAERGGSERVGGPPPVVMRLHSGLPIRMALTRLNQIGANYEKMNDKAKAEFNVAARGILECGPCQKYYVVSVTKFPNPSGESVEEAIFQGMTMAEMKGMVRLRNEKGEVRELAHFIAPLKRGDSAVFFFPRLDEKGNVFLTKDNTDMSFLFDTSFFARGNRFGYLIPRQFDFKVSKITVGDNVVF